MIRKRQEQTSASTSLTPLIVIAVVLTVTEGQTTYTYHTWSSDWWDAKVSCECEGNIAILDTQAKQTQLLNEVNIPAGECVWIGASTYNDRKYRWIELPPNYGSLAANGKLLNNTYSNFAQGVVPEETSWVMAVCIFANGTWVGTRGNNNRGSVCEWMECEPGRYKGNVSTTSFYCESGVWDACLPCPDDKIKSVSGDDPALCLNVCDGITNVPNTVRTACVCNAGYYGDGTNCVMCTGNMIKTSAGNEPNCSVGCDRVTTVPNANHTDCECNAGYNGSALNGCALCPGNMIKPDQGDAPDCHTECNPHLMEPNAEHTECVCFAGFYKNGEGCEMCSGNTIKMTAGNEPNCTACDETTVPNEKHTDCVCLPGHKMLADGSCSKDRFVTYNLKQRDVEITSDELVSMQVVSIVRCGAECAERNCEGFSFHQQTPDVGMCNMIMTKNGTYQPLEGADYYTKP